MAIVDAHVHLWTPDTERYPVAPGFKKEDRRPASFTPEELFALCKPEGVERIVVVQVSHYGFDNAYLLDSMKRFPGVFGGIAVVDWTAARPDEAMVKLAKQGVRGFRVRAPNPPPPDWMETESFDRMFRCAAAENLAICPLLTPEALPSVARMCAKHLKTRVVIDHLGRVGQTGEFREADIHALCSLAHFPEARVKVSGFYALGKKKPPHEEVEPLLRRVHASFGARRLMWGSDAPPALLTETYRETLAPVRDRCAWLTAEDREWMLRRSAEAVFF